jgi:uncharacterized membrane protein
MKKPIGIFMILMGSLMILMWIFFLLPGMVPELATIPLTTGTHIAAEIAAGSIMIYGGICLLLKKPAAERIALYGLGMFVYAVIQAPGYYLQKGMYGFPVMFLLFLILGLASMKFLLRSE